MYFHELFSFPYKTIIGKLINQLMIYYIFIDGIGFGKNDVSVNPFSRYAKSVLIPLSGKDNNFADLNHIIYLHTDALLDTKGLPQSATGQTALWTGINSAKIVGRHISGFPTFTLKKIIKQFSLLKILKENGIRGKFVNCYTLPFFELMKQHPEHLPASTLVQLAAGYPLNTIENLRDGTGIYMDITNEYLAKHANYLDRNDPILKRRDPFKAGRDITNIKNNDILLFEYFLTDKAGHDRDWQQAEIIIGNLEAFLNGIMQYMSSEDQLIVTSDHGNLENLSSGYHTDNPVPTILYGKYSNRLAKKINSLPDIPRAIYDILNIDIRLDY